jgi:hypothetical protein
MARSYIADTIMIEFDILDEEQVDIVRTGLTHRGRIPLMRRRRDSVLVRCEAPVEAEPDESYADIQGWAIAERLPIRRLLISSVRRSRGHAKLH